MGSAQLKRMTANLKVKTNRLEIKIGSMAQELAKVKGANKMLVIKYSFKSKCKDSKVMMMRRRRRKRIRRDAIGRCRMRNKVKMDLIWNRILSINRRKN